MTISLKRLSESYICILFVAISAGFLIPATKYLVPYNTLFLQIIFFISSLKLHMQDVARQSKDWKLVLVSNILMLFILPIAVWIVTRYIATDMAFPLFLLAAMPVGMTAPLLVEIVGGNSALALITTISTSLLAPLTIPLLTSLAFSTTIHVDTISMFQKLLFVIFLPFIFAIILKRIASKSIHKINARTKPISLLLLGLLIASAIASHSNDMLAGLQNPFALLRMIVILYIFFLILHIIGYYSIWWKSKEDRSTLSVCLTYMNFTLAIVLALNYFNQPKIILPLVLSILPWATLLPIWKKIYLKLP